MPISRIDVTGPADRLLFAGLPHLQPVIDDLGDGVMLIGGLAATAWTGASERLESHPATIWRWPR